MFEIAEIGNRLTKAAYKKSVESLRTSLLETQHELAKSKLALAVVIGGVEGSGKTEFVNRLLTWLDTRGVRTHAFWEPTDEERQHPPFWRFWRVLPPTGHTGLFLSSWYTSPIVDRAFKRVDDAELNEELDRIIAFERMLVQERVIVVKLWLHITKKEQGARLKSLEKDPQTRWRVTAMDWKFHKRYDRFRKVCERALRKTSTAEAPWQVVEATDRRFRDVTAGRVILDAMARRLAETKQGSNGSPKPDRPKPKPNNVLRRLDLARSLTEKQFDDELEPLQETLGRLARKLRKKERSLILAFEGPDAAGKGGAIRRITGAMDARLYRVDPVSAPSDEERSHPYLWRFWRELPGVGRVTIYDRTWYGRVLVERVEGFARPEEWSRAFAEINAFEEQLADFGTILLKFWIAISPEEQLRRFKSRRATPYKQYKITEDDWRNRDKWNAYEAAACEMIERTSTECAPWTLVEGEDKRWARIKVLQTIVERLDGELS